MSTVKQRTDGWWIVDLPDVEDCGPYDTCEEAESGRRGLERFFKCENHKGFITSDPVKPIAKEDTSLIEANIESLKKLCLNLKPKVTDGKTNN